ncbi:hypothetical protein FJV76_13145 [Mesorhizobium sp. WSM4303]|uniref:hypothetical protein n=1 Tax=unclassified Mesorhizobium TaxID=325217 RepID=UPI00115D3EE1|nr:MULTISPECIES: hypothetical protein [unclassified Mesorhizobium]TRC98269.1 hypothetical protein FJV77_07255 [Mesorhizobium sp. WSM4306]TRD04246.1 hypothetical protein FJV76_13145 [Mesorhizobium sp. WSM4303]
MIPSGPHADHVALPVAETIRKNETETLERQSRKLPLVTSGAKRRGRKEAPRPNVGALPPKLESQRPVGPCPSDRPFSLDRYSFDHLSSSPQNQIGIVFDLIEPPDYQIVQKQKARGSVQSGSPFAISI